MQVPESPTWIRAACPHRRQPGYVLPAVTSTFCTASRGGSARLHCKTPSCEPESAQVFIKHIGSAAKRICCGVDVPGEQCAFVILRPA